MRAIYWQVVASLFVAVAVVAMVAGLGPSAAAAPETVPVTLEDILRASGLDYAKVAEAEGLFKILVTMDDETSLIIAHEAKLAPDPDLALGYLYTRTVSIPKDMQPSRAMLRRMAELNEALLVGKLGLSEDAVYYNSSFWLRNADGQTLTTEVVLAQMTSTAARQELLPFLEE